MAEVEELEQIIYKYFNVIMREMQPSTKRYLSVSQVANKLSVSRSTIYEWLQHDPTFAEMRYILGERSYRFKEADIDKWMDTYKKHNQN